MFFGSFPGLFSIFNQVFIYEGNKKKSPVSFTRQGLLFGVQNL